MEFPAGLITKSKSGGYQNGLLLKKVVVEVPAKSSYKIALLTYCANASKSASSSYETYEWAVISNSSLIVDLCNRVKNKKINYEDFLSNETYTYSSQVYTLQGIVWKLTDYGNVLSEIDIKYIDDIPNI